VSALTDDNPTANTAATATQPHLRNLLLSRHEWAHDHIDKARIAIKAVRPIVFNMLSSMTAFKKPSVTIHVARSILLSVRIINIREVSNYFSPFPRPLILKLSKGPFE